MYHDDTLHCPECKEVRTMKVMQGSSFVHEKVLCYWRRKKCLFCGHIMKSVEVPADRLNNFYTMPQDEVMTNGS